MKTQTQLKIGERLVLETGGYMELADRRIYRIFQLAMAGLLCLAAQAFAGVNIWTRTWPETISYRHVFAVAVDPRNPSTVYAGNFEGLYKSTDGGRNWIMMTGLKYVNLIEIDPVSSSTLYAGAGSGGVYQSTDGGATWNKISGIGSGMTNSFISDLAIDPSNPSIIYAAANKVESFIGILPGSVFRSVDGGNRWRALELKNVDPRIIAIDPSSPSTLYVGTADQGVFKSVNGGATWSPVNSGLIPFSGRLSITSLAIDSSNPSTLYVSGPAKVTPEGYLQQWGGVFKTTDGGMRWSSVDSGLKTAASVLVIDPSIPSTLYSAGLGGVSQSRNGGESWSDFNLGLPLFNLNVSVLAIDPSGKHLYAAADGDLFHYEIAPSRGVNELCLLGNRFRVSLSATDPRTGTTGIGQAIAQGDRFGYFSLPSFTGDPAFPEVFVKMADATALPSGSFWVFHSGLTDLQYTMTVTDTSTGALKVYRNDRSDPSRLCGGADTGAFKNSAGAVPTKAGLAAVPCTAGPNTLCLLSGRFGVTLTATDPRTGNTALGQAIPQADRFGYFSLPGFTGDATFPEVFVKMVDATSLPGGFFWVFHTGLTDLQYTLSITDSVSGAVKVYQNDRSDPSRLCGGADTAAFGN